MSKHAIKRFMTNATASKSTAAKPARKTRTRKAAPKKPVSKVSTPKAAPKSTSVPVAKVTTTTFKSGKVTQKKTEFTRPSTRNLITWERYTKDVKTRWQIHQYEIQELLRDLNKGLTFVTPYHDQLVKQVREWTVN